MASEAVNCDLTGGALVSLPQVEFLKDFTAVPGPVEKAYRFPSDDENSAVWLPLPSRFSSVVASPLANDDKHRVYWSNPGDQHLHVNTRDRIAAGDPSYNVGIVQPTVAPVITGVSGGDTTVPPIDRSYAYTYLNTFGEESSPSPASNVMAGPPDATWTVTYPGAVPGMPAGVTYAPIDRIRLYRVVTSASSGAQFYRVTELVLPASGTFVDSIPDSTVVLNEVLESVGWGNPPDYLDGLVALTGGILAGFTTNTVHFTEPNRPHTWPSIYDQSVHFEIVAMAAWQQYLMVMTKGFPSAGSGNNPSNFQFVQSQVAEPCIARGSVVVDLSGVFYASQNGLVQFTGYQINNITAPMVEKNEWLSYYNAPHLIGARHRQSYIGINDTDRGFVIDYSEPARLGFEDLSTMEGATCIWNDETSGDTLLMAGKKAYEWDCPTTEPQIYRWRSKTFTTPTPLSLGAVQVDVDAKVLQPAPTGSILLDNGEVTLPAGVNAVFNYYAGPNLNLIMTRHLTVQQEIFRLPNGFKTFDHVVEIVSRVPVYSLQLSTTLNELKGV